MTEAVKLSVYNGSSAKTMFAGVDNNGNFFSQEVSAYSTVTKNVPKNSVYIIATNAYGASLPGTSVFSATNSSYMLTMEVYTQIGAFCITNSGTHSVYN